jgi:hypothetical protein
VANQLPARRVADQRDPIRVTLEFRCMRFCPTDRRLQIFKAGRPGVFGRKTIVDGEPGEIRRRQRFKQRSDIPFFAAPTATMDEDRYRKRALAFGNAGIEQQRFVSSPRILDIFVQSFKRSRVWRGQNLRAQWNKSGNPRAIQTPNVSQS